VHFVSLINVLHVGDGGAGSLGDEQLALGHGRSQGARCEHADRGIRAHAALDGLPMASLDEDDVGPRHRGVVGRRAGAGCQDVFAMPSAQDRPDVIAFLAAQN
jgi:hypothetical protein